MDEISKDALSIIFNYLEYEDILNLTLSNKSNKFFNKEIKDMPIFLKKQRNYIEKKIKKVWNSDEFSRVICDSINLNKKSEYEKFLKINYKTLSQSLKFLYYDILFNDNYWKGPGFQYKFLDAFNKLWLIEKNFSIDFFRSERENFIIENLNTNEITITNHTLKILFNITRVFNFNLTFENFIQNILEEKEKVKENIKYIRRKKKSSNKMLNILEEKKKVKDSLNKMLNEMKCVELREICRKYKIRGHSRKRKFELINLILEKKELTNSILDDQLKKR